MVHVHEGAIVLLDPYVEGTYGGTGKTLDWNVASEIAKQTPTVLAGGLTPDNVGKAVGWSTRGRSMSRPALRRTA